MMGKFVSFKMNKLIHSIHVNTVVIYKKGNCYYSIDNDVYLYKALFNYKFCNKNKRMVIFITKDYLDYVLNMFKVNNISFVIININYGYDNILEYNSLSNDYYRVYMLGKRMIRNERKVKDLINRLRIKGSIDFVRELSCLLDGNC